MHTIQQPLPLSPGSTTPPHKITGLEEKIQIRKRARDHNPKNHWNCLERRQTKRGREKKRHNQVPIYLMYQNWLICLYKQHNQLIFHAMKWGRKWNGSWIVDAQIISHQEKVILSNTLNLDKPQKQNHRWEIPHY